MWVCFEATVSVGKLAFWCAFQPHITQKHNPNSQGEFSLSSCRPWLSIIIVIITLIIIITIIKRCFLIQSLILIVWHCSPLNLTAPQIKVMTTLGWDKAFSKRHFDLFSPPDFFTRVRDPTFHIMHMLPMLYMCTILMPMALFLFCFFLEIKSKPHARVHCDFTAGFWTAKLLDIIFTYLGTTCHSLVV